MKLTLITFTCLLLFSTSAEDTKLDLLCQKWRQVGIKSFGKNYVAIDKTMSEVLLIKSDGTYEKELYGTLKMKGQWKFSNDSFKIAFALTEMNGTITSNLSLAQTNPTDSIIKLTRDTFIDGQLKYFGEHNTYGHDDIYFVREK